MPIPNSASKRKQAELDGKYHTGRPDTDNMIKYYLDLCLNVVLEDDAIVSKITAQKIYDQNPRTQFTLMEIK